MKSVEEFKERLSSGEERPAELSRELTVLWLDKKGEWAAAHDIVDSASDSDGCWIHAYLHRVEGDDWNAGYWYDRAGRVKPDHLSLEEEWESLVAEFLSR